MKVNPCVELDAEERNIQYKIAYGEGEVEYLLGVGVDEYPEHYNEQQKGAWQMGWRSAERSDAEQQKTKS